MSDVPQGIKWMPGEPNNLHGIENCLSIREHSSQTGLNDFDCDKHALRFMCQKSKYSTTKILKDQLEREITKNFNDLLNDFRDILGDKILYLP